ncbi:MAG TPA: T9SS type A sorting domain-containing protein, partial [Chitinophagaceae bacterium]|nr:T9SS type A sorting domain-containing protein [Chitinophagaceae bacterium]
QSIRLNLLNYQGKLLTWKEQKSKAGTNTILFSNLENLCKGIYLLQFVTEDGVLNEKLIKIN